MDSAVRGRKLVFVGLLLATACTKPRPKTILARAGFEITSPMRGTFLDGTQLTVTGRADGAVRVMVNGIAAKVGTDGTFTATLSVSRGIAIVETHAIDATGHDVRDVRAVLAGTVAPSNGSVPAPIGAQLGRTGMIALGEALAASAKAIDFTAAAKPLNPIFDNDGCLGARVDITSVTVGKVGVELVPKADSIETTVVVEDTLVTLRAGYEVACIGGSATITVRAAKARVRGDLGARLVDNRIRTTLARPTVTLEGFTVDVGGIPGPIESLLRGRVRNGAESALASAIQLAVPALADAKLAELLGRPLTTKLLDRDVTIAVAPRKLVLTSSGLFVVTDTTLAVAGGEGGVFASTPVSLDGVEHAAPNLGLLIADDAVNQLFAGLWASRAFDRSIPIAGAGPLATILDDDVQTLEIVMSLPPTVTSGETLELAIGDVIITGRNAEGGVVQRFAISLRTTLSAVAGAQPKLVTTTPTVYTQVLDESAAVQRRLDAAQIEGLVSGVWGLLNFMINAALANVPMPSIAGIVFEAPGLSVHEGYLVLDAGLR